MQADKEKYIAFCNKENFIPIFSQPWWLDAVCVGGNWDVLLYEKDGLIIGALPYYLKKRWGLSYVTQPQFTQNMGVVIKYPDNQKSEKKLSYEKEVMTALIEQLEKLPIVFYQQYFNCKYTNWLPFYWKGYKQTTNYTYRIEGISDIENVVSRFDYCKKSDLKNANRNNLVVLSEMRKGDFYKHHVNTLESLGKKISYSNIFFDRLWSVVLEHKAGCIMGIQDKNGVVHSMIVLVWDHFCAYNLMTSITPEYRKSRSSVLLFKEAIKIASIQVDVFDFEGSMIESIEDSYRKFGTVQMPYFYIRKNMIKNRLFRFFKGITKTEYE